MQGRLHTEALAYDGGRDVTVYLPPGEPEAVVYAGDGQAVPTWGRIIEAAGVVPTAVVGAHGLADETARLHEYSPVFDGERFAAHEHFLVNDLREWATSTFGLSLPAGRTAVFGASAGGELALAVGLRHPDIYGAILCGSPGAGFRPPDRLTPPIPRTYLVAGTLEPFFLANATRWAAALRAAGAEVVMAERHAGHGGTLWRDELPAMVSWAFAPPQ